MCFAIASHLTTGTDPDGKGGVGRRDISLKWGSGVRLGISKHQKELWVFPCSFLLARSEEGREVRGTGEGGGG